jgi:hypothetical protein
LLSFSELRCTGVSSKVAAALAAVGIAAQLLLSVRAVTSQLEYSVFTSDARQVQGRLSEVHSCIVAVDDALDMQPLTSGAFWCTGSVHDLPCNSSSSSAANSVML